MAHQYHVIYTMLPTAEEDRTEKAWWAAQKFLAGRSPSTPSFLITCKHETFGHLFNDHAAGKLFNWFCQNL